MSKEKKTRKAVSGSRQKVGHTKTHSGRKELRHRVPKQGKKKIVVKKGKKKTTATKRDKFGCRIGGSSANVNSVLTRKPLTMKQIIQKTRSSGTYYTHLGKMIKKGFVEKTDKGYRLIKK